MAQDLERYAGQRVLLTGHTGFKGSWLVEWLMQLGADVTGLALAPEAGEKVLFDELDLSNRMPCGAHNVIDIRDRSAVADCVRASDPDFVIHMAAQPLVRYSYQFPVDTFDVNVMGTVNLLESIRALPKAKPRAVVVVTTDKCYLNREWEHAYRETDALGGYDPYSASKAGTEIVAASYRQSFFSEYNQHSANGVSLATARAGNVIGGGDWATDRILPDCVNHLSRQQSIPVRNPHATRPWQHVLEPLAGYLQLGSRLMAGLQGDQASTQLADAYNFGPPLQSNRNVLDVVEHVLSCWPGAWHLDADPGAVHEAGKLNLAWDRAHHTLGWQPRWDFSTCITRTIQWYRSNMAGACARELVSADIQAYMQSDLASA